MNKFLTASTSPVDDIEAIAYEGQPKRNRLYHPGYEQYFNQMPVLNPDDYFLPEKVVYSGAIMQKLAADITPSEVVQTEIPAHDFERHILALEGNGKEGSEFVLAKWGDGFTSPVHGHATGFLFEQILKGTILVNSYRMVYPGSKIVRLISSEIHEPSVFVNTYTRPGSYAFKRQAMIHNFTSIGYSASLHYIAEHTRDGRDNSFEVEHFEDWFNLNNADITQVTTDQALTSHIGSVFLVRSSNVPEYGDHFIVITGRPQLKPHGLRPKDTAIIAPHSKQLLDQFESQNGVVLLQLSNTAKYHFLKFHDIVVAGDNVIFPSPEKMLEI